MLGLIIGATAALAATGVAWLCNRATEAEERRQAVLRDEIGTLQQRQSQWQHAHDHNYRTQLTGEVQALCCRLAEQRQALAGKIAPIEQELNTLHQNIQQQLQDETASPYRRRALQQSCCQVEDGLARAAAYRAYLDWYQQWLENNANAPGPGHRPGPGPGPGLPSSVDELQALLARLTPPSPVLPDDWLYVGKVVMVQARELDKPLTPFRHRLHLNSTWAAEGVRSDSQQQALFHGLNSEDVPVQVVRQSQGKPVFYGCVARGRAWVDGVLAQQPLRFEIERSLHNGYLAQAYDGLLKVMLPRHLTSNPLIKLSPGENIDAWLSLYDLCLNRPPGAITQGKASSRKRIEVSMLGVTALGTPDDSPLYLLIDPALVEADMATALLADDQQPWRLLSFEPSRGQLQLARHHLRIDCQPASCGGWLKASALSHYQERGEGLDVPLQLVAADQRLASPELANPDGLTALLELAAQLSLEQDPVAARERQQQTQMMQRWQATLAYQLQQSSPSLEAEVVAINVPDDGQLLELLLRLDEPRLIEPLAAIRQQYKAVLKNGFSPSIRLDVWQAVEDGHRWTTVPTPHWKQGSSIELIDGQPRLYIEPRIVQRLSLTEGSLLRLQLRGRDEALVRQQTALDAFRNDRQICPEIRQILLAPTYYRGAVDPDWQQRLSSSVQWHNPQLTDTQKGVIRTALCEKHLALIQGPPGTAKTTCIVEMLYQIFSHRPHTRVLLVSQQHAAVDNALNRFIRQQPGWLEDETVRLLRIGHQDKVEGELSAYTLQAQQQAFMVRSRQQALSVATTTTAPHSDLAWQWINGVLGTDSDNRTTVADPELNWLLLRERNLVGATCVGLASSWQSVDQLNFDIVIIDEAGRSTVPELLIPMLRGRKVILIGDHFQLPPSVAPQLLTEEAGEALPFLQQEFLETSFFERLYNGLPDSARGFLGEQFRMPPAIGDLVATLFYSPDGKRMLWNGQIAPDPEKSAPQPLLDTPICWHHVEGQQEADGTSKLNRAEAAAIISFVEGLACHPRAHEARNIAIITPYGAQKRLLRQLLKNLCGPDTAGIYQLNGFSIRANTVDSFQGSEAEIVCYSTVRTRGNLRFILDWKRLNVACSRAEENLLFFGNRRFLQHRNTGAERNLFAEILALLPENALLGAPVDTSTARDSTDSGAKRPSSNEHLNRSGKRSGLGNIGKRKQTVGQIPAVCHKARKASKVEKSERPQRQHGSQHHSKKERQSWKQDKDWYSEEV